MPVGLARLDVEATRVSKHGAQLGWGKGTHEPEQAGKAPDEESLWFPMTEDWRGQT